MRGPAIDSDARAARTISRMLASSNVGATQANLATDGVGLARRYQHAVVLLDLVMSGMLGTPLLRRMGGTRLTGAPLILSRLDRPQARTVALAAGADDYLTKLSEGAKLLSHIRRFLPAARQPSTPRRDGMTGRLIDAWRLPWAARTGRAAAILCNYRTQPSIPLPEATG